jgi:hypothetical protein
MSTYPDLNTLKTVRSINESCMPLCCIGLAAYYNLYAIVHLSKASSHTLSIQDSRTKLTDSNLCGSENFGF